MMGKGFLAFFFVDDGRQVVQVLEGRGKGG